MYDDHISDWEYNPNLIESEKGIMDQVGDWIVACGYVPETSIECLVEMILLEYDSVNGFSAV